jgi:hypothetical protein
VDPVPVLLSGIAGEDDPLLLCADGARSAFDDEGRPRSPADLRPGLDRECDIGEDHDRSDENEGRTVPGPGRVLLDPSGHRGLGTRCGHRQQGNGQQGREQEKECSPHNYKNAYPRGKLSDSVRQDAKRDAISATALSRPPSAPSPVSTEVARPS